MLRIADTSREGDIGSPPTWHALYRRLVGLVEVSRCRWADHISFVWRSFGLARRFCSFVSLHIKLTSQLRHRLSAIARRKLAYLSGPSLRHSSQHSRHNSGKPGGGFTHARCLPCFRACIEIVFYGMYPVEKISTLTSMNHRPYSDIVNV